MARSRRCAQGTLGAPRCSLDLFLVDLRRSARSGGAPRRTAFRAARPDEVFDVADRIAVSTMLNEDFVEYIKQRHLALGTEAMFELVARDIGIGYSFVTQSIEAVEHNNAGRRRSVF